MRESRGAPDEDGTHVRETFRSAGGSHAAAPLVIGNPSFVTSIPYREALMPVAEKSELVR